MIDRLLSSWRRPATDASSEFLPLPLLSNPHVQTVLGHYLPGPRLKEPAVQHTIWLPDGDGLAARHGSQQLEIRGPHCLAAARAVGLGAPGQILRMAYNLLDHGLRVVRMDLRGAGDGLPLARRFYHAGRSEDVRVALAAIHRWSPTSPLVLLGTSLGGNQALKLAGESADHPVPGLERVIALAPPIDLTRCCEMLAQPKNRFYEVFFLRDLIGAARKRQQHFPDLPALRFPRNMTMRLFDDLYTAPRSGFADALDYYRRASSAPLIQHIPVPTLILTAQDDPFIAVTPFEQLKVPKHIIVRILRHGGHVGFIGRDGAGGIRWAERRIVEWAVGG